MEELDDLEKYQGKWKNQFMNPKTGAVATGHKLFDSEKEANEAYEKQIIRDRDNGLRMWAGSNGVSWPKSDGVIYLGAIPVK